MLLLLLPFPYSSYCCQLQIESADNCKKYSSTATVLRRIAGKLLNSRKHTQPSIDKVSLNCAYEHRRVECIRNYNRLYAYEAHSYVCMLVCIHVVIINIIFASVAIVVGVEMLKCFNFCHIRIGNTFHYAGTQRHFGS